jgi:hypothetical protein
MWHPASMTRARTECFEANEALSHAAAVGTEGIEMAASIGNPFTDPAMIQTHSL